MMNPPEGWEWELELTPHLMRRMVDRANEKPATAEEMAPLKVA
jgi:hypothetical protein